MIWRCIALCFTLSTLGCGQRAATSEPDRGVNHYVVGCPKLPDPAAAGEELAGKACPQDTVMCDYLIEECEGYLPVQWRCQCRAGLWDCLRGYDCPRKRDGGSAPKGPAWDR